VRARTNLSDPRCRFRVLAVDDATATEQTFGQIAASPEIFPSAFAMNMLAAGWLRARASGPK
jgi:hypothetical protein